MFLENCKVLENKKISEGYYLLKVKKEKGRDKTRAGQFFMIESKGHFLRRPISIHSVNNKTLEFYYEVKGDGTRDLSKLRVDDEVNIQGPLGNGFETDVFDKKIVLVGGGMGIAPMKELIKRLLQNNNEITFIAGGRNKIHLNILENFGDLLNDINLHITTDDGSLGNKMRVDEKLKELVKDDKFDYLYTCGPQVMMKSIAEIAHKNDIKAYVSLEARMACGLKACVGCSIMTNKGMQKVCHDGPVFLGEDVIW